MKNGRVEELLQSLEHEMGGEKIYKTALSCVLNPDLKLEWTKYLDETRQHVSALKSICHALSIDPSRETRGRSVVRRVGAALEEAIKLSLSAGDPAAAELVASECVVLAETKGHLDWELLGKCAEHMDWTAAKAITSVSREIEDPKDEHLYHSKGFCRELWLRYLEGVEYEQPDSTREDSRASIPVLPKARPTRRLRT